MTSALNTTIPVFQGANFHTWQQEMGDYLKSQQLWFHVATLMDGGRGHPVETVAGALSQAEADAQVAWDNIQCLGIFGLHLSPNVRTHLRNTACLTRDSLNTMFRQLGMSVIFADYSHMGLESAG